MSSKLFDFLVEGRNDNTGKKIHHNEGADEKESDIENSSRGLVVANGLLIDANTINAIVH